MRRLFQWGATVVAVLLIGAMARALPFVPVVTFFYALGTVLSGAFVLTWFPLAFKALLQHRREVSLMRIVDYAGLQLIVFLAFGLTMRSLLVYEVRPPQDEVVAFARVFLPMALDVIVGLRLYKWCRQLWSFRRYGPDPQALSGVSQDLNGTSSPR